MRMTPPIFLILHAFIATGLIGAIAHQTIGVVWPPCRRMPSGSNPYAEAAVRQWLWSSAWGWLVVPPRLCARMPLVRMTRHQEQGRPLAISGINGLQR